MKLGLGLLFALGLSLITVGVVKKSRISDPISSVTASTKTISEVIPPQKSLIEQSQSSSSGKPLRTVTLEKANTYVLKGVITGASVGKAMREMQAMSRRLSRGDMIYLVLDTPGGSVSDGAEFIDFLETLPQKVTTVTLFAASMGFHIVESNPGPRLITKNGTLMSHRATVSGLEGEMDGELESRYKMLKRQIDQLDYEASARMSMPLADYKTLIIPELWVWGFDAQDRKVADESILLQCGESMVGEYQQSFNTVFGNVLVTFDACPIVKAPIAISLEGVEKEKKDEAKAIITQMFERQEAFVKTMIITNQFTRIFP